MKTDFGIRRQARRLPVILLCLAAITGCDSAPETEIAETPAIARVNGKTLSEAELEAFMQARRQSPDDPEAREAAVTELINLALLAQEARRQGLLDGQVEAQLQVQELSLLANLALTRFAQSGAVSDEQVEAEYTRQVELTGGREYRIRHLLVPEQMQAINAIERLRLGESFEDLATESGEGGDLGWVNLAQVPSAFSGVLRSLKPGQYTTVPIQSEYGWHVIFLDEVRGFEPPALESVEEGIRNSLSRAMLKSYVDGLRGGADIERIQ